MCFHHNQNIVLNAESVGLNHSRFALLIEGQE